MSVPQVLVSGNHAEIRKWRDEEARKATANAGKKGPAGRDAGQTGARGGP
jgi:hypothetical protein